MRTPLLASLALVAALAGCGDTLVDHRNVAIQDTGDGATCGTNQVLCGDVCKSQDPAQGDYVCGTSCTPCGGSLPANATRTCTPTGPGGHDGVCGYTCAPGLLRCAPGGVPGCCPAALVASGGEFSCAATSVADGGEVHCWGAGDRGQLGDGAVADRSTSSTVAGLASVTTLAAGGAHACATSGGTTRCWGDRSAFGGSGIAAVPEIVSALANATALAAGTAHTCAIVSGGVTCLGAGTSGGGNPGLASGVTDIAAGDAFTCALQAGAVKCWGEGASGQLGTGGAAQATGTPQPVTPPGTVTGTVQRVAAGARHACAATDAADLALFCWGDNASKQLTDFPDVLLPPTVLARVKKPVSAVSAGGVVSCAVEHDLNPSGSLTCWSADPVAAGGGAGSGEPVLILGGSTPGAFSTGGTHTCFVEAAVTPSRLHCFGHNGRGQLGDGTTVTPAAGTVKDVIDD
jgi:hypothetical protein